MKGIITESSPTPCMGGEGMTETKREFHNHKYALKASMPCGSGKSQKLMRVSMPNKNHAYGESSSTRTPEEDHKSNKLVITQLIKPIEQRLSILEEEDGVLKEDIFRTMEERRILMNEIFKEFQAIHNQIRASNQERENNPLLDEVLASIQALKNERRPGLMQVLWQESNPSLISRCAKARAVTTVKGQAKKANKSSC